MHPDHHAKIIAISASIIVVIVLILGLTIVVYKRQKTEPAPVVGEPNPYHVIVQSTTALKSSSIDDPKIQELNQLTSASGGGSGGDREVLIQATSQGN